MELDDFLDHFNLFDRLSRLTWTVLSFLPHHDLRGHWRVTPGLVEIRTERYDAAGCSSYTGGDAERLLKRYGVPIHGRRVTGSEFIFSVPAQQAKWAEYIIARSPIAFGGGHRFIDERNVHWGARHAGPAPAWIDLKERRS